MFVKQTQNILNSNISWLNLQPSHLYLSPYQIWMIKIVESNCHFWKKWEHWWFDSAKILSWFSRETLTGTEVSTMTYFRFLWVVPSFWLCRFHKRRHCRSITRMTAHVSVELWRCSLEPLLLQSFLYHSWTQVRIKGGTVGQNQNFGQWIFMGLNILQLFFENK